MENKNSKKKVIKVGVGKPYIRGESPRITEYTREKDEKLKVLKNANNAVFKSKEYTIEQKTKLYDSIEAAQREQLKNKTYFSKKKKKKKPTLLNKNK